MGQYFCAADFFQGIELWQLSRRIATPSSRRLEKRTRFRESYAYQGWDDTYPVAIDESVLRDEHLVFALDLIRHTDTKKTKNLK